MTEEPRRERVAPAGARPEETLLLSPNSQIYGRLGERVHDSPTPLS